MMLKVGIIGATGQAGSELTKAAQASGQIEVTALVRNGEKAKTMLGDQVKVLEKDAFALTRADLADFDVIVDAFATAPDLSYLQVDLAAKLVSFFRETTSPRLVFILGAGSLQTGDDHHLFVDDIAKTPGANEWIAIPQNQLAELEFLRNVKNVNWVGVSPGAEFKVGPKAAAVKYGHDELLFNDQGESFTTYATMGAVLTKEIIEPQYHQERFTVINQ